MNTNTNKEVFVYLRGNETIHGVIIDETTTHFKVVHEFNRQHGEWFAKKSLMVSCHVEGTKPNIV